MADVVLVTGASSDVGGALLERLASTDAVVIAHHARGGEKLQARLASLVGPATVVPMRADFASAAEVEGLIADIRARFGRPNKIVHLAAVPLALRRFAKMDWADVQRDLDVSVRSLALLCRAFLPELAKEKVGGRVVVMSSSVVAGEPPKGFAAYTIVKFAQLGLMRSLAAEYAGTGVTVNGVAPSTMETAFLAGVPHKFAEIAAAQNPTGRNATPADVVPVVELLLSDAAGFLTGVNVPVTGGATF